MFRELLQRMTVVLYMDTTYDQLKDAMLIGSWLLGWKADYLNLCHNCGLFSVFGVSANTVKFKVQRVHRYNSQDLEY